MSFVPEIDVLIPTAKKRLNGLLYQIRTCLSQGLLVRVTVGMSGEYLELVCLLSDRELERVRFVKDVPEGNSPLVDVNANNAISYCMENLEWADWYYQTGDDDCLLPWGLSHLYENRDGVQMVVGRGLCVTKDHHKDITLWDVGRSLTFCKVSGACTLFNFRAIEKLQKPWWNPHSKFSDFELISRMALAYTYKMIPSTVAVLALDETSVLTNYVR